MAAEVSDLDLAYAAGIFDGEGCVGLYTNGLIRHANRSITRPFNLEVDVANTSLFLMEWLYDRFGGTIQTGSNPAEREHFHYLTCYHWCIRSRQADTFLRLLLPFLKVKHLQAETALRFYGEKEAFERRVRGKNRGLRVAPEELERRSILSQRLRLLKKDVS